MAVGDTFTEATTDTLLENHVPTGANPGTSWAAQDGQITVKAATDTIEESDFLASNQYRMTDDLGSDAMDVQAVFTQLVASGRRGVRTRLDPADSSGWEYSYDASNGQWLVTDGATADTLVEAWPGGAVTIKAEQRAGVGRLYVNGVLKITKVSSQLAGRTRAGVQLLNFDGTGPNHRADTFTADKVGGSDDFTTDRLALDWAVQTGESTGSVAGGTWRAENFTGGHRRTAESYTADQYAQATVTNLTNMARISVRVRCASAANTYYAGGADPNDTGNSLYRIWKLVAGTWTSLIAHASRVIVVGDVVRLTVVGSTLSLTVNGAVILTTTDSSIATGQPGFGGGAVSPPQSQWDNWSAANVTTATPKVLIANPGTYLWVGNATGAGSRVPEMPRVFVDTTYALPGGTVTPVAAGANLQTAINAASLGDVLVLEAGATFAPIDLPSKAGSTYIYIISSALAALPVGARVGPAQAASMPKIVSTTTAAAITTASGAHHYRFVGIEIATTYAVRSATHFNLIALEKPGGNAIAADCPHHIIFDRCYIHGTATGNVRRGILGNAIHLGVVDCYLRDFHEVGADNQAFACWNTPGPIKLVNNYLEAACENILIGGADSASAAMVPSDIEIRNNQTFKPLSWRVGDPTFISLGAPPFDHWTVKNIFELKCAQRVWVDSNLFERNWGDAQNGYAILFTPRNQDGTAPWSVVQDVNFTNNIVRHSAGAFNILGKDNLQTSLATARIRVKNTQAYDIDGAVWNGTGAFLQMMDGGDDITFDHNTGLQTGFPILFTFNAALRPAVRFVFTNNIVNYGSVGIFGDFGLGNNLDALASYASAPILIAWTASVDGDVNGYNAYFGQSSGVYTAVGSPKAMGNVTSGSIRPRFSGATVVALKATDTEGLESTFFSNEINGVFPADYDLRRNAMIAGTATNFPADNLFPVSASAVGFTNLATFDLRLLITSQYHNAGTDGLDLGALLVGQSPFVLTAGSGMYAWTGNAATLTRRLRNVLTAAPGTYGWIGSPATLLLTQPGVTSRRLTLTQPYRVITSVLLTIQNAPGETAVTVKVMDLQANPGPNGGPLIEARDAAGNLVPAHVHAVVNGY